MMVTKVSGGHNCWLADNSACGTILTTWISNWANATGAASATHGAADRAAGSIGRPELEFPGRSGTDYQNTVYTLTSVVLLALPFPNAVATQQSPYFADPVRRSPRRIQAAIPKIDFTGCMPFNSPTFATTCGVELALLSALADG